jgi:hypothetical protein
MTPDNAPNPRKPSLLASTSRKATQSSVKPLVFRFTPPIVKDVSNAGN